jgi:hypothetical protein
LTRSTELNFEFYYSPIRFEQRGRLKELPMDVEKSWFLGQKSTLEKIPDKFRLRFIFIGLPGSGFLFSQHMQQIDAQNN